MLSFITQQTLPSVSPILHIDLLFLVVWVAVRLRLPGTCSLLPGIFFTAVPLIAIPLLPLWAAAAITLIIVPPLLTKYMHITDPHAALRNAWGAALGPGLAKGLFSGLFYCAIAFVLLWSARRIDLFIATKFPERNLHA